MKKITEVYLTTRANLSAPGVQNPELEKDLFDDIEEDEEETIKLSKNEDGLWEVEKE
ncbi:MAG TPA: hypothetical protein VK190_02630 [Pseudoneobacillus sp.]|nr:hypothetical protein [Pseudoneobacillus sp.]